MWNARVIPCLLAGMSLIAEGSGVWLDVPFVKQEKNGCGAASIAMVMQYWQRRQPQLPAVPSLEEIQRALYSRRARGIYASDLERYLRQHGFRTFAMRGEWTDLRDHLEKGRPLIVALTPGRNDLHYVVLTGLDWRENIVLKHDPADRKLLKQHRSDFEREWTAAGNWALLAVPDPNRESSSH